MMTSQPNQSLATVRGFDHFLRWLMMNSMSQWNLTHTHCITPGPQAEWNSNDAIKHDYKKCLVFKWLRIENIIIKKKTQCNEI